MSIWSQSSAPNGTCCQCNTPRDATPPGTQFRAVTVEFYGGGCYRWFPSILRPTGGLQGIDRTANGQPAAVEHVRADYGCLDILVAKLFLDGSDVAAVLKQMRDKEVRERAASDELHGPASPYGLLGCLLDGGLKHVPAAIVRSGVRRGPRCRVPGSGTALREARLPRGPDSYARTPPVAHLTWASSPAEIMGSPCPSPWEPPRWAEPIAPPSVLSRPAGFCRLVGRANRL